jgi:hypothetical protein
VTWVAVSVAVHTEYGYQLALASTELAGNHTIDAILPALANIPPTMD